MKRLAIVFFALVLPARASAPPHGDDRLRELVVYPAITMNFAFGWEFTGNRWAAMQPAEAPDEPGRLREEVKAATSDPRRLLRLGSLCDEAGLTNESQKCFENAERRCRDRLAVAPQDGLNLTDLGEALTGLDRDDEAESAFRHATLVSPNEWRCWVGLGNFLSGASGRSLLPENLRAEAYRFDRPPGPAVMDYRPAPGALEKSEAELQEAAGAFGRALALAPGEPEVFFQYGGFSSVSSFQEGLLRHYRDHAAMDSASLQLAHLPPETVTNLERAAELDPKNYQYLSLTAYFQCMRAMIDPKSAGARPADWPETTRQSVHGAMSRLEDLGENNDPELAAGALENLGMLDIVLGNFPAARASFRRAVALDPARESAWEGLLGSLVASATPEEITATCEARLKHRESARNHLLLARALQHQSQWARSAQQAAAALKLDPDNFTAHLELAALALRQSADPDYLARAGQEVARAAAALKKESSQGVSWPRWRELSLDAAILYGLTKTPEYQAAAKTQLEVILKYFPADKQALQIRSALN